MTKLVSWEGERGLSRPALISAGSFVFGLSREVQSMRFISRIASKPARQYGAGSAHLQIGRMHLRDGLRQVIAHGPETTPRPNGATARR